MKHSPVRSATSCLFALGLILVCSGASVAANKPDFSEAAAILKRGIQEQAFPGCTVVVGTADKVLWSEALGNRDYVHNSKVQKDTMYDLASVTKVAGTTSVFMRLVETGKINISDPVCKYLPEFVELAPEAERAKRRQITVEHLLTHTTGLTGWKPFYRSVTNYSQMLQAIFKTPLESDPGEKFRYSDPGMMLAGEVAARAGGKPLASLERELVFEPLAMKHTMRNPPSRLLSKIAPTEKLPDSTNIVHGVVHDENARAAEGITGHAGLFSTAEDLGKIAAELLRAHQGRSKWLSEKVLTEFASPQVIGTNSGRGLGWGIEPGAHKAIGHNGFTGTYIRVELDRKMFVVLLTNRVHPTRDNEKLGAVRRAALESILCAYDQYAAVK